MKKIFITCISIIIAQIVCLAQAPASFIHPGVFSSQNELDALKLAVATQDGSPAFDGYTKLAGESLGDINYHPTPYADVYVIASGSCPEEKAFRQDAHALYIQAVKWVVTGNMAYRDKAIEIADSWAKTFKRIIPETNKPNQSTLEASWALPIWVAGAEILKYYNKGESGWSSVQFDGFVKEILTYVNGNIYQTANWLISRDLSLMSAGVFLNDADLYNLGYNHVTGQIDDITVDGKIPELSRDFVHSQYVLIGLTQSAEIAWQQGDSNLFTQSGARLRTGAEAYVLSVTGVIEPKYFSSSDWARHSAPYEILLNRYTLLGLPVPNVQNYIVNYNRTENGSEDHFVGWLSATHAISISGAVSAADVPGNVAFNKNISATSEPQPENPATAAVDNNNYTRWSATGYPQSIEVDLGSVQNISKTAVICFENRDYQFKIEVRKTENDNYIQVVDRSANTDEGTAEAPITNEFDSVQARYVKLTITGASVYAGSWVSIVEFRIYKENVTTTGMIEDENKPKVYPNPATDILNINGKSLINTITIYDSRGRMVLNSDSVNAQTATLDISSFIPGMYLFSISDYNRNTYLGQLLVK